MNLIKPISSNDGLLLQQIKMGCKTSFNILFEKYWTKAYSDAYKRLKDADQAKDIVQEVFTHIWLKRETLFINNLPAYLNIAVRNRVFKLIEKQKNICPFFDMLEQMPSNQLNADGNLLMQEFLKSYEALLKSLPPKRQLIFRLYFQEDMLTNEIAQQMGISRKTVQNQLGKGVEKIRTAISHSLLLFLTLLFLSK
jgi:RNA polymerase sigma-70 factor (family 1)